MRVVIAPDSFKGSATAAQVARAIARGWLSARSDDDLSLVPMADGGEGTLDAFEASIDGSKRMPCAVEGPDGSPRQAHWLLLPDGVAVIELANTCGITLQQALRPLDSSSAPFGEAIAHALEFGVSGVLLAIGSSASTDGGVGMLSALGGRFFDSAGRPVGQGGRGLGDVSSCDLTELRPLPAQGATILSDVSNPLLGSTGAAAIFGPQKGATAAEVALLDAGLERLATVLGANPEQPGAGAAGGVGYGLQAWGASTRLGASVIAELLSLPEKVVGADLVITGEGMFDHQSTAGKAPGHVISLARAAGVPVAVIAGRISASTEGFVSAIALEQLAVSLESAIEDPTRYLVEAGAMLAASTTGEGSKPTVDTSTKFPI